MHPRHVSIESLGLRLWHRLQVYSSVGKVNMRVHQLTIAIWVVLSVPAALYQTSSSSGEIRSANARRFIGVNIEVYAKDAPIVIPACGSNVESGEYLLCGLASRIQVHTSRGWRPVSVRKGLAGELGGVTKEKWSPSLIARGDSAYFSLTIDPDFLDVRQGEQLRVVLDAWSSENAMRTEAPEKQLTSPSFACP